jgi:GT2 family glycosyltransferase
MKRTESRIEDPGRYAALNAKEKRLLCNFDNVSSCIRRDVWREIRFYKTDFGEDIEWSQRALKAGYTVIYEPRSSVYHSHDYTLRNWFWRNRVDAEKLCIIFGQDVELGPIKCMLSYIMQLFSYLRSLSKLDSKWRDLVISALILPIFVLVGILGRYCGIRSAAKHGLVLS